MLLACKGSCGLDVAGSVPTPADPLLLISWLTTLLPGVIASLGVSFAGAVGPDGCVSAWPNRPGWAGFPLGEALSRVAESVSVADDGVAAATGEVLAGVGYGRPDVLVAVFGSGLGGGLVLNGTVRPVAPGDARTLGHLRILPSGRCGCGETGCAQVALATLPPDDDLGVGLRGWPDGQRLVHFLTDLARFLNVPAVVLTGGLLCRTRLRAELSGEVAVAGIEPLVPSDPALSSVLGACLSQVGG